MRCICYCASQGIALRSNRFDPSDNSINNGNYLGFVNLLTEYCPELKGRIESGPRNAKFPSTEVQNTVIQVVANMIQHEIIKEIKSSKVFSIIFDETTDKGTVEQLTLMIR